MSKRLIKISNLLAQYSLGNFDYKISLSPNLDEIDSIISGINMLGEELQETTISRDFFSTIYNSVSNFLFVINSKGIIIDCNQTAKSIIQKNILGENIDEIFGNHNDFSFENNLKIIAKKDKYVFETVLNLDTKRLIISCVLSKIIYLQKTSYLLVAEDVTEIREYEKSILRTIIDTENKERKRLADDLHDSLGQRLSTIKILLGIAKKETKDKIKNEFLDTTIEELDSSILELRNICFDLMPASLENGGLIFALEQLIQKTPFPIYFETNLRTLKLTNKQEVVIYRVIQEFINNSIKHAKGTKMDIKIVQIKNSVIFTLSDDGVGFSIKSTKSNGRGMHTMQSRIESHGGKYLLTSKKGEGVVLKISFNE
jgi:PAS domain S-box-containing protein